MACDPHSKHRIFVRPSVRGGPYTQPSPCWPGTVARALTEPLVRRRNDYDIRPNCLQPSLKISEAGHPEGLCLLCRLRRRIDDGGQLCLGFFEDALDMSLSDHTRPGDGNASALHHTIPPLLVYHSGPSAHCAPPFHGSRVDDKKLRAPQAPTVASDP